MSDPKQTVTLDVLEALLERQDARTQDLIKAVRAPADPTPQQLAEIEQAKQMRKDRAALEKTRSDNRKLNQSLCDHSREDGTAGCVPVYNNQGTIDFLVCQSNQCIIHPGVRPTGAAGKDTEHHIYDNATFSRELRRALRRPAMIQ